VDLQAIDRAHRIGQKREVVVYRFVTEGSVEEKIVERAARKLKVDHLIMQKGKFTHNEYNPGKMNSNEMASMIKYGAQEIILSEQDGVIKDENIDNIIGHSLQKTEEINKSLSKIEEKFNLNNVSLTGEDEKYTNLYEFEGEDYKKNKNQAANIKVQDDFIEIGQRERKIQNYDVEKYYREALNIPTSTKEKKKLKGWKAIANGGFDHQFFDNDKLDELDEKEANWLDFTKNEEEYLKVHEGVKPVQFTKKDQMLKQNLLSKGFSNWSKKDFYLLIRVCETYGRDDYENIKFNFPLKSMEDIRKYCRAFW